MSTHRLLLSLLAALWVSVLVTAFIAQTTELFGARSGVAEGLLLGAAASGFIAIGTTGVLLTLRWLARDERSTASREREPSR